MPVFTGMTDNLDSYDIIMKKIFFLSIIYVIIFQTAAWAHKVNLFCWREDGVLRGEAYFSGGRPAQDSKIEVYNRSSGVLLAESSTDAEGAFSFELDSQCPLRVVLYAGQGHQAEFFLENEGETISQPPEESVPKPRESLELESAIDKKLNPLNKRIAELEKKISEPSFSEIAGGIGWIIGIFALLYFFRRNRKNAS